MIMKPNRTHNHKRVKAAWISRNTNTFENVATKIGKKRNINKLLIQNHYFKLFSESSKETNTISNKPKFM